MRSLFHNGIAMLVARMLPPAFSFAINVSIARLFGTAALGHYVHLLAVLLVFQAAAGAGFAQLLVRDLAARPDDRGQLLATARSMGICTGLSTALLYLIVIRTTADSGLWVAGLLLAGTLPASAWATIQEATLIAAHRHHLVTLVALGENALRLALAIVVFFVGGGLTGLAAGILLGRLAGVTIGGLLLRRCRLETSLELQWAGLPAFARRLAPFAVILTSAMIYYRIDIIAVEALTDAQHTGLYGAALTLYSMALMIPESAMAAVYPRLSAAFQRTQAGYATASWQAAAALGLGLVPVALGLAWVAQSVVGTLYGPTFSAAAPTLTLLAATLPIHGINNALGQALLAGGRVSETVRLSCAGTAGHVILTFLLVSRLGNNGAPVAMLLSSTGIAVATFVLFRRHASSLTPGADRKRTSSNGALALVLGEA